MSKIGDYKNFNGLDKNYFVWFVIYISIGMIQYFTLPFPISVLIYLGIILILQTFRIKKLNILIKPIYLIFPKKTIRTRDLEGSFNPFQILCSIILIR